MTSYPILKEDHDLSPEEERIRQSLKRTAPTLEEVAELLAITPERQSELLRMRHSDAEG